MAAELRLNVALDLQYFKRQLPKLSQAAAGFQLPIQVKFDGRQLRRELNKLTGRREFRINLNDTSIKSAIDNVKTLKRELEGLERKSRQATASSAPIGTSRLSRTKGQGGLEAAEIQALYKQAAAQGIEGFQAGIKINRPNAVRELAKLSAEAVKGLVAGLKKGQGQVGSASENLAKEAIDTLEDRLEIRSPSRRMMKIGRQAAKGFEVGMSNGLKRAQGTILAQLQAMLIAMQAEVRGFGQQGGFAQIGAASRGAMGAPGRMLTSSSGRPRFRNPSVSGPLGVSSALTGPSLYGQGRLALPAAGQSTASLAQASKEAAAKVRAYGRSAERAAAVLGENDRVTGSGYRGLPSRSTGSALALSNRGAGASGGGGGGRFGSGFARGAGDAFNNLSAGPIASVAKELKYATSQVLLFGTAYKALAAATALPGNIAKATANLQAFNNQMEAVTGGGEVMANSMRLIEETVARFNIPVQSARDGFVKLYASMQPAGIDLSTINSVFTGLSAAASTFGMSADQVDRMTYALAQMASKGQIMTEELKGQLGDVFPQAVSLFARAAGFLDDTMDEQAKSKGLASFLKALEDGALKGETMSAVLANVGKLLNKDFGPSADKAANSFQNQINKLNNALTTFYESFAPAAGAFLGEFVDPIVSALSTVGEAVKLAFSDEPLGGNQLAEYLRNELFPQLVSIKDAILAGAQTFALFGQAASVVLRPLAQLILGNQQFVNIVTRAAIVGAVLKAGLVAIRVTGIIPLIRNLVMYNKVFRVFIAQSASGATKLTTLRAATVASGMAFRKAAVGVRILATAIRTVLVSSAIGIALVAIGALIEKIMQLKATAESIEAQKGSYGERVLKAAEAGGSEAMTTAKRNVEAERKSRQKGIDIATRLSQGEVITAQEKAHLQGLGGYEGALGSLRERDGGFGVREKVQGNRALGESAEPGSAFETGAVDTDLKNATAALASSMHGYEGQLKNAEKNAAVVDKRFKDQSQLALDGLDLTGGDGKDKKDLSPEMVAIRERLREINRGLLMDQQGVNEFMKIEAELALEIQRIKESDQGTAEKIQDVEDARLEATKKKAAVTKREMEKLVERLSEEESARRRIQDIILESDLASGRITQEEYDRAKHLQSQADKLKEIARLRKEGKITPEAAGAVEASVRANVFKGDDTSVKDGISSWMKKTEKELKDFGAMAESVADGVASEFGTAFSGILQGTTSLQEGLGTAFSNIGKMFADMVAQMIVKWAMLQAFKGLGFAEGGVVSASSGGGVPSYVPGFATGGIVKGPTMAMVGEGRFNEAIVPLPNGKSIPVEMGGGAGSNISTNITVNVNNGQASSKTSGSQGNDLARNLEGAVKQVIMREMQPGGMISSGR